MLKALFHQNLYSISRIGRGESSAKPSGSS
jgi:hypothetical protein